MVAILTCAGDRVFSAGSDLKEMAERQTATLPPDHNVIRGETVKVSKPVIAAGNGSAFAGGWMMAQSCDLCIASEAARFAVTEAIVGRGMAWSVPLKQMIPQRIWMELLLTAEPITAKRAYEVGLVNHVVPAERLLKKALQRATTIAANAPLSVRAAKKMVYLAGDMGTSAARRAAEHVFDRVFRSKDAQEAPRAFREKRPPVWLGE